MRTSSLPHGSSVAEAAHAFARCAAVLLLLAPTTVAQGWQRVKLVERRAPGAASAYDAARGRIVMFGGFRGGTSFAQSGVNPINPVDWHTDTLEWDGQMWTERVGELPSNIRSCRV